MFVRRYTTCALLLADHVASFPDYRSHTGGIEWGTWRCNLVACAILSFDICSVLPSHHFVTKMTGSFCGALSAFGSTADESVRLLRHGRLQESALNLGLNILVVLVFLGVVLRCGAAEVTDDWLK